MEAGCGVEEQKELARVLLERNRRAGWVALIRVFDRLDPEIQELVVSRPRDLFGPLSETMHDSDPPARENVIAIVRRCADGKLVYLLAEALMDARVDVREMAGNSLLEAVRKHREASCESWESEADNSEQLRRAIEFSWRQYKTHRQQAAIVAGLIFERQQDAAAWAFVQDPYDDLTRAATLILRSPAEPALAAATLLALGSPLRSAAMAGLTTTEPGPVGDKLVAESYRLLDPTLREGAKQVGHIKLFTAQRKGLPWTAETWPAWLRLIDAVGMQPVHRLALLTQMVEGIPIDIEEGGVVWKLSVLKALVETDMPDAGRAIAALVGDADERVARYAARALLLRRGSEWQALAALVIPKSMHAAVRKMAIGLRQGVGTFEKVWGSYAKLPPAMQHSSTRTGAAAEPRFGDKLRDKLASDQPLELAQGLKMLSALPELGAYRESIIGLCGHPDARIAAIAVRLIGRLEDPKLKDLLDAAAKHNDPRVRANAVESMAALHIADKSQQVLTMLNSRHNRERANAIKAMSEYDYSTARECLARMLADPNPMHRISALWVVSQLQILGIVRQVSSIARKDPNLRVRRRATEMLETMTSNVAQV